MDPVTRAARWLERGAIDGVLARCLSRIWGDLADRRIARELILPPGIAVIAVGGATLGGSGKTPLALACARAAERAGANAFIVGHAYRASPKRARVVCEGDDVARVGDEALASARAGAKVIVAPTRQAAVDHAAAQGAQVIVLDGVTQTSPQRATLALLALQAEAPWGAGACPPRGDLRASIASLRQACDALVTLRDPFSRTPAEEPGFEAVALGQGAWKGTEPVPWSALSRMRLGLFTALARPDRVLSWLERRGIFPRAVISVGDHRTASLPDLRRASRGIEAWVATEKCAIPLSALPLDLPVLRLDYTLALDADLEKTLRRAIAPALALTPPPRPHSLEIRRFLAV